MSGAGPTLVPPDAEEFAPERPTKPRPLHPYLPWWVTAFQDHPDKLIWFILGLPAFTYVAATWNGSPNADDAPEFAFVLACVICGAGWWIAHFREAALRATAKRDNDQTWARTWSTYTQRLEYWWNTRPETLLQLAANPAATARALVRQAGGTMYLGVYPDSRFIRAVPRNQSVLILAVAQSGKTTGITNPGIIAADGAVVATSTKLDTLWATFRPRVLRGRIWLFDPTNSLTNVPKLVTRVTWSPRSTCATWDGARRNASAIVQASPMGGGKEPYWDEQMKRYLAPLLFAAALHQDATMIDVRRWVNDQNFAEPMTILVAAADDRTHPMRIGAGVAAELLAAIRQTDARALSGVTTSTGAALDAYNTEALILTKGDENFDAEGFVRSSDTLYIVGSADDQELTATLNVGLIEVIRRAALDLNRADPFDRSDRPPILFALDEMSQIAPLRKLPLYLGDAGGQGMQFVVVLQTLAWAKHLWPQVGIGGVLELFNVKVAFGGISDKEVLESLSALTGDYDREYVTSNSSVTSTTSESWSESTSTPHGLFQGHNGSSTEGTTFGHSRSQTHGTSTSYKKERRYSPADVATVPPGNALVITRLDAARSRGSGPANLFQLIEVLGTFHPAWAQFTTPQPIEAPAKWIKPHDLPKLIPFRAPDPAIGAPAPLEVPAVDQPAQDPQAIEAPSPVPPATGWSQPPATPQGAAQDLSWIPGYAQRQLRLDREAATAAAAGKPAEPAETLDAPAPDATSQTITSADRPLTSCPACNDDGHPDGCPECDQRPAA
jgi:hypothetical protein